MSLVINYEEGAEYSLLDGDPINDTWGETSTAIAAAGARHGDRDAHGVRQSRRHLADRADHRGVRRSRCSVDAPALALERNPAVADGCATARIEVIGHGYRWTEDSQMTRDEERQYLASRSSRSSGPPASACAAGSSARCRA